MNVPAWLWVVTVVGLITVIFFDFYLISRNPRDPSMRECTGWIGVYVGLAVLFGLGVLLTSGPQYGGEFFAGWITEYSLSVDNLFVFVIIMSSFAVPREYRQKVLSIGIVIALVMRGIFILVGYEAITRFDWLFYVFGAFLVYTAWKLMAHKDEEEDEFKENAMLRFVKKIVPATDTYSGARMTVKVSGRRMVTPMLIVMVAIGTTDLLFALDSIPAIFGLTKEPYLVFTANAFALMGLRQLFFLIGGLLDKLVYLSIGLSVVLGFIGLKLISEALHHDGVSWAPEIPILVSLGIIVGTLAVTTVASLWKVRRDRDKELDSLADEAPVSDPDPA
ncbi:TerC family protein [Actinophytocola algeriensis]|uniref:Tellurite resistance protein TerC n=1 Tax=Actinophytocola algeriensis TaxID=1768010 RepID=A0A7W7Q684_9PSEU|nr:TerC family protein [Actinophytocola algeriensis]MBB4907821.1 tellurite resistance protein TerC [Actinophytocola algeriensis]MBE1479851.1 tellurite resistance protein TerC [Actinophytocola algeriensis]